MKRFFSIFKNPSYKIILYLKLDINFMIKMDAIKTLEVIPDVSDVFPEQILKVVK